MRLHLVAAGILLFGGAMNADAQRPDSSRTDSTARSRADSSATTDSAILAREMMRIRREPRVHDTIYAVPATQRARTTAWSGRVEIGVAYSSVLVDDANGITVRTPWAPALGAGLAWGIAPATRVVLAARASTASVQLQDRYDQSDGSSAQWSPGRSWVLDGMGSIEHDVRATLSLQGGVGVLALKGPSDVAPFGKGGLHAVAEAGASWRLPTDHPLFVGLMVQSYRAGGANAIDPVRPGSISRVILSVRHGR
ncbi:MAG: hypothetical protein M3068_08640 [Gemmatimonadota bacterium]|nr:hypothetical protein [Gemmatimonadota bacterium]